MAGTATLACRRAWQPQTSQNEGFCLVRNTCAEVWPIVIADRGISPLHIAKESATERSCFLQHIAILSTAFVTHSWVTLCAKTPEI